MAQGIYNNWSSIPYGIGIVRYGNGATIFHGTYFKYSDTIGSMNLQDMINKNIYLWSIDNGTPVIKKSDQVTYTLDGTTLTITTI